MANLLLIVLAVATMGMTFSGQHLTASMLEIDLSPSPLYPKARRGGGAYATLTELFSWILFKVVSSTLSLQVALENCRRNTEGGQQGKIAFQHSSSHAGPLVARARGSTLDPWLGDPTSLLPLLFWLSICSMAIG